MEQAYTIAATLMRYVFVALMAYILIRLVIISIREWSSRRFWEKQLEGKAFAQLEVIEPYSKRGALYDVSHKTTIGRNRACDIQIRTRSIAKKHAIFFVRDTLYITAYEPEKHQIYVNDSPIGRQDARLFDGDTIKIGRVTLKVHIIEDEELYDEELFDDDDFIEYGSGDIDEDEFDETDEYDQDGE
ncbi:MAG TPA: FHA domain-containing protein [Clostridiales bacterium]|jgi:hypothetical protein|nr:FHA domain-containing protein [Clostridiales bacterium]